jgi:integrase
MSAKIHFYLRTDRPSKDGSAPIYLMFSLSRTQRIKLSTGKTINLKKEYIKLTVSEILALPQEKKEMLYYWDVSKERATKGAVNFEGINTFLDGEMYRAKQILLKFELLNRPITIELFKQSFLKPHASNKFLEYCNKELEVRKHELAKGTYNALKGQISKINRFRPNLTLGDIDYKFLTAFENYMLAPASEKGLGNQKISVLKTMKVLRSFIRIAIKNGDFPPEAYPFRYYKIKNVDVALTTRDYLEPEDLYKIEQLISPEKIHLLNPGEIKATKRFLFSCYTGLRFSDVIALRRSRHIFAKWVENPNTREMIYKHYIEIKMGKTDEPVFIPLIDRALDLINESMEDAVFEKISNQKVNKHLKEINKKAELNKKLSFHVARHSFATICFLYGIPENVGQKLLGHKNRKFTEVYTHLSKNKLFYEMDKVSRGLSDYEVLMESKTNAQNDDLKAILPIIQGLNSDQLKGLLRLLGGKAA